MKVATYTLAMRDLIRDGKISKATRICNLVLDWDIAVAKYKLDQAIIETIQLTARREKIRHWDEVVNLPIKSNAKVFGGGRYAYPDLISKLRNPPQPPPLPIPPSPESGAVYFDDSIPDSHIQDWNLSREGWHFGMLDSLPPY
jgi:hypothetical protein